MTDSDLLAQRICKRLEELDRQRQDEIESQFWAYLYRGDNE